MIDNSPNPDTPLYAVQAVTEGGEESMFSQTEETEENILKDMEAMNYGYPFDGAKVSILGVESSVDAESYVSPTFAVYFNPTKYANEYTVYQSEKEPVFVFDMEDLTLTDEENGIYSWQSSNGIESVTYDSINNIAVANVAIGLVNIKTLTIDTVNIIGRNTTVSDNETPATEISTLANANARRALNKYEYVNIFTAGLSEIVTAANTAFGGDWYGGTGASDYDRDAYTKGSEATVKGCSSKFWQDKDYRGYITLTEYKPENVPITMTTSSNITVCHVNGDEAGYWGTDPLGTLNPDSNDGNSAHNFTSLWKSCNLIDPRLHRRFGTPDSASGKGAAFRKPGVRRDLPHIPLAVCHSASAVGHERNDCFSGKVFRGQECPHGGSHRAPPVRGSEEDDVVLCQIPRFRRQFRTESALALLFRLFDARIILCRVRLCRFDFEQRSAGDFPDLFRRDAGVPAPRIVDDQHLLRPDRHFLRRVPILRRASESGRHCGRHHTHHCFSDHLAFLPVEPCFFSSMECSRKSRQSIRCWFV